MSDPDAKLRRLRAFIAELLDDSSQWAEKQPDVHRAAVKTAWGHVDACRVIIAEIDRLLAEPPPEELAQHVSRLYGRIGPDGKGERP